MSHHNVKNPKFHQKGFATCHIFNRLFQTLFRVKLPYYASEGKVDVVVIDDDDDDDEW